MEPDTAEIYNGGIKDSAHALDAEKSSTGEHFAVTADSKHHFDAADLDRVQRRLKQRHVQM